MVVQCFYPKNCRDSLHQSAGNQPSPFQGKTEDRSIPIVEHYEGNFDSGSVQQHIKRSSHEEGSIQVRRHIGGPQKFISNKPLQKQELYSKWKRWRLKLLCAEQYKQFTKPIKFEKNRKNKFVLKVNRQFLYSWSFRWGIKF